MDFSFLACFKGLFSPVARASWKSLRKDLYRRKVASGEKLDTDIVGATIDEALNVLANNSTGKLNFLSTQLHRLISNATPLFKKSPELNEWINDEQNRKAIKYEVLNVFNNTQDDAPRNISRDLFVSITKGSKNDADRYIDMACEYAAYSLLAYIDPNDKIVLDAVGRVATNILESIEGVKDTVEDIQGKVERKIPIALVDSHAKKRLNTIAQRSPFGESATVTDLKKLVEQIENGELVYVSADTACDIYDGLVVALCNEEQWADAEIWHQKSMMKKTGRDYSVNEARIKLRSGDKEKALQNLRGNNSPDALSFSVITIAEQYSLERAKEYFSQNISSVKNMTPRGVHSLAILAATDNDWSFAEKILSQATEEQIKNYPCLLSIRGVFRARMCCAFQHENPGVLVAPLNPHLVKFSDEPDKIELRRNSLQDISTFLAKFAPELNIPFYVQYLEELALWLRLVHPDKQVQDAALKELAEYAKDKEQAIRWIKYIQGYNIPCDLDALSDYLDHKKLFGGWTHEERFSCLLLALEMDQNDRILKLIDEYRKEFSQCLDARDLLRMEVEALYRSGKQSQALELLRKGEARVGKEEVASFVKYLEAINAENPLLNHREAFASLPTESNRRLLISALNKAGYYEEAAEHMIYFFDNSPNIADAESIISNYIKAHAYHRFQEFMEKKSVELLISQSPSLKGLSAWSAYFTGDLKLAKSILATLQAGYDVENNYALAANIANETGKWEDLIPLVLEVHQRKELLPIEELLKAANTVWLLGMPQNIAEELLSIVFDKAMENNNLHAYAHIYSLLVKMGLEKKELARKAFKAALAAGEEGPFRRTSLKEFEPLLKDRNKTVTHINRLVSSAEAPLALAAIGLGSSLPMLVLANLLNAPDDRDFRHKTCIPLFAGNRPEVLLREGHTVIFDRTTLLTLSFLGLLEQVFGVCSKVLLPHSSMPEFLHDIEQVRFHQPSQIEKVNQTLQLIAFSSLKVVPEDIHPDNFSFPAGLDWATARLIGLAHKNGGSVILSGTQYKQGSSFEELCDLSCYEELLVSVDGIVNTLLQNGKISSADAQKARSVFEQLGAVPSQAAKGVLKKGQDIYIDRFSIECLIRTDLMKVVTGFFSNIFVDKSVEVLSKSFISEIDGRAKIENIIKKIRECVANGVECGKINFSPLVHQESGEAEKDIQALSTMHIIANAGGADYLAVDDRFLNKFINLGKNTKGPVLISTLDLLKYLFDNTMLSEQDYYYCLQLLRNAGFAFINISKEEIVFAAKEMQTSGDKSYSLQSIGAYINFVLASGLLRTPEELLWVANLNISFMLAIREIWTDSTFTDPAKVCSYLWDILPPPDAWINAELKDQLNEWVRSQHCAVLLSLGEFLFINTKEKKNLYEQWFDGHVLPKCNEADTLLIENYAAEIMRFLDDFEKMEAEETSSEQTLLETTRVVLANISLGCRKLLAANPIFNTKYNLFAPAFVINDYKINADSFLNFIADFVNENNTHELLDVYGNAIPVILHKNEYDDVELVFENGTHVFGFGDLLSSDSGKRVSSFDKILCEHTIYQADLFRNMLRDARLSCGECLNLIDAIKRSPENHLASLKQSIMQNSLSLGSVYPCSIETIYAVIPEPAQCETLAEYSKLVSESWAGEIETAPIEDIILRLGPLAFLVDSSLSLLLIEKAGDELVPILKNAYRRTRDPFTYYLIFQCCSAAYSEYPELIGIGDSILDELLKGPTSEFTLTFTTALLLSFSDQLNTKRHEFPLYMDSLFSLVWSGYIARELSELKLDKGNYYSSVKESTAVRDAYVASSRRFKIWDLSYISPEYVFGLISRHMLNDITKLKEEFPASWQEKYTRILSDFASLEMLLPHPLAEFASETPLQPIDSKIEEIFDQKILADDTIFIFSELDSIIRTTYITEPMYQEMKKRVLEAQQNYPIYSDSQKIYMILDVICYAAAVRYDTEMATAAVHIAQQYAFLYRNDFEYVAFLICWAASQAYIDRNEHVNFIRNTNEQLAFRCSSALQAQRILRDLETLEKVEPDLQNYLSKTKAIYKLATLIN